MKKIKHFLIVQFEKNEKNFERLSNFLLYLSIVILFLSSLFFDFFKSYDFIVINCLYVLLFLGVLLLVYTLLYELIKERGVKDEKNKSNHTDD